MTKKIEVFQKQLAINEEEIAYILNRSKQRKRSISMRINRLGELQINAPYHMSQTIIDEFIAGKYAWIKTHQEKFKNKKPISSFLYENDEMHGYLGKQYALRLIQSQTSEVFLKDQELMVFHRKNSSIKNILNHWYKTQALDYLTNRTLLLAEKYSFPKIRSIKVRNMKARWGSCSSRSEITYNTHLIKTSNQSIDYVIIHELCHLIHQNHSARFYQLQTEINPNWKAQKQILNHFVLS